MISKIVFDKCLENCITMGFAESMTGGALTYEMVKNPGASKVVIGSVVSYQIQMKEQLLDINPKDIKLYHVVSKEISKLMAKGIYEKTKADICISVTGNAGPTFEENTSKLEVYTTVLYKNTYHDYHLEFKENNRIKNIKETIEFIYQKVNQII